MLINKRVFAVLGLTVFCLAAAGQSVRLGQLGVDTQVESLGEDASELRLMSADKINSLAESDPVAYPVATNALAHATNALALAEGALQAESDTFATVTARGATTTEAVTIGSRGVGAVGVSSFANGENVVASGIYSHAEGLNTTASADASHAEGFSTTASGIYSHAEGLNTTASADASHAEGLNTTASADASHAEGFSTTASAQASHAEGFNSAASNITAFAWQGSGGGYDEPEYGSHGPGTYNLNPVGGLAGLWIGETNMATTLSGYATTGAVAAVQAEVGAGTNWLTRTGLSGTVAFANDGGRPQAWSGSGELTVSGFTGLTPPTQVYWTLSGFDSVSLPSSVYLVGGGSWQTNAVNHFTLWAVGTNTMMSFITTTPIED